jgi:hypothetical protein
VTTKHCWGLILSRRPTWFWTSPVEGGTSVATLRLGTQPDASPTVSVGAAEAVTLRDDEAVKGVGENPTERSAAAA